MSPYALTTYNQYFDDIVRPDYDDFCADVADLRRAMHCAVSLFHMADWVYKAHGTYINANFTFIDDSQNNRNVRNSKEFSNSLGQTHPDFQLIRGIANSLKHFSLHTPPSGRINPSNMPSSAANTYVVGAYGAEFSNDYDIEQVKLQGHIDIEFKTLASSVIQMWQSLLASHGW